MPKKIYILVVALLLVLASGVLVLLGRNSESRAQLTDGANAINLLGQYDTVGGALNYSKSGTYNTNNNLYLYNPGGSVFGQVGDTKVFFVVNGSRVLAYTDVDENFDFSGADADFVVGASDFDGSTDQLNGAQDLFYDYISSGKLFVTDSSYNRVLGYDISGLTNISEPDIVLGQADFATIDFRNNATSLNSPAGLTGCSILGTPYLIVADQGFNRVLFYNLSSISNDAAPSFVLGQGDFDTVTSSLSANGLSGPTDVTCDDANDTLYIVDRGNNRILVHQFTGLDPVVDGRAANLVLGQVTFVSSDAGAGASQMDSPNIVALDSANDRLLLAELGGSDPYAIYSYDTSSLSSGMDKVNLGLEFNAYTGGLSYEPTTNRMYWSRDSYVRVYDWDSSEFVAIIGTTTPSANSFDAPQGIALDTVGHRLFTTDNGTNGYNRVLVFDLDTNNDLVDYTADAVLGAYEVDVDPFVGVLSGQNVFAASALLYDAERNYLFVADRTRILIFDVAAIENGESAAYVLGLDNFSDANEYNVGVGVTASSFDFYSSVWGRAGNKGGMALSDDNKLFVADFARHRVLIFDTSLIGDGMAASNVLGQANFISGDFVDEMSPGPANMTPIDLVYDNAQDRLFVSDLQGKRVLVFDMTSISDNMDASWVIGQADFVSNSTGTTSENFDQPGALALDDGGLTLYVADVGNNRVLVFDVSEITNGDEAAIAVLAQDSFLSSIGAVGQDRLYLSASSLTLAQLAYNPTQQSLWVADSYNNRYMNFDVANGPTAPSLCSIVTTNRTTISLAWTDNSDNEDSFIIEKSISGGGWSTSAVADPDATSYEVSGLQPNKIYSFRVSAYNTDGQSTTTSCGTDTTATNSAPDSAAMLDLEPDSNSLTRFDQTPVFTWAGATDADDDLIQYRLEFSGTSAFATTLRAYDQRTSSVGWSEAHAYVSGAAVTFSVPEVDFLNTDATYYWRVRAYDSFGAVSSFSEVAQFTTTASSAEEDDNISFVESFSTYSFVDTAFATTQLQLNNPIRRRASNTFLAGSSVMSEANATRKLIPFDADQDGDLDILEFNEDMGQPDGNSFIYFNDGAGVFSQDNYSLGNVYNDMALGDINNDGYVDIVKFAVNTYWEEGSFAGDFTLHALTSLVPGICTIGKLGDLDNDGDLDMICASDPGQSINVAYINDGTGTFSAMSPNLFTETDATRDLAIADLNGDHWNDVIVANELTDRSRIYINNQDGTFSGSAAFYTGTDKLTTNIIVVDFDNDSDLDVAISGTASADTSIYLNDGTGTFVSFDIGIESWGNVIANGDIDGDGDQDLIVTTGLGTTLVYRNRGDATFEDSTVLSADDASAIAIADFNGDGTNDVLLGFDDNSNQLFLNNANIQYASNAYDLNQRVLAVFDSDNDGDMDLYQSEVNIERGAGEGYLMINDGTQNYTQTAVFEVAPSEMWAEHVLTFDADNDGYLDLLEINGSTDSVPRFYQNQGENQFNLTDDFDAFSGNIAFARFGDLNNDGYQDLVFNVYGASPQVWWNDSGLGFTFDSELVLASTPEMSIGRFALGDVNGDGYLDLAFPSSDFPDVLVYYNAAGDFSDSDTVSLAGAGSAGDIDFVDIDGDGDLDLFAPGAAQFALNVGGAFASSISTQQLPDLLNGYRFFVSSDLDFDGDIDFVVASEDWESPQPNIILRNHGNLNFVVEAAFVNNELSLSLFLADYDSDGDDDIFTLNPSEDISYRYDFSFGSGLDDQEIYSSSIDNTVENIISATLTSTANEPLNSSIAYYLANNSISDWWAERYEAGDVLNDVFYNGVEMVIVGDSGIILFSDNDGETFTDFAQEGLLTDLNGSVFDDGIYAVGDDGMVYHGFMGELGLEFEQLCHVGGVPLTSNNLNAMAKVSMDPYLIAVGDDSTMVYIDYSNLNDITCQVFDTESGQNLNDVAIGDGVFAVGDNGAFVATENLSDFFNFTYGSENLYSISIDELTGGGDYMTVAGANGTLMTDLNRDLGDFDALDSGIETDIWSVVASNDGAAITLVGDSGVVRASDDFGSTWSDVSLENATQLRAYVELNAGALIMGASGFVYNFTDGGVIQEWEGPVTAGEEWTFTSEGSDLYWKAILSNEDKYATPVLHDITVSYSLMAAQPGSGGGGTVSNSPPAPLALEPTVISATSIQWNFSDSSDNETGFRLFDADLTLISEIAAADIGQIVETGLSPDIKYTRYITAYNVYGESNPVALEPVYTFANKPSIETLVVTSSTSVALSVETNSNPSSTKYAIYESSTAKWLQPSYLLGTNRVFRTAEQWLNGGANIPITSLTNNALYSFKVQAQNGNNKVTDLSESKSIVVYRPNNASLVLSKKVGVNVVPAVAGVYLGQSVFAGTEAAQKVKLVPLMQRYANIYVMLAGGLLLLFLFLLVLNAHPRAKHLKNVNKILFVDFAGNNGDLLFEYLHGENVAKHGAIYRNHHHFYKLTNLGFVSFLFGLLLKVSVVVITAFLVYGSVQVQAFVNQSGVDVKLGDQLTYQIEYTNNGALTAHNVLVTEPIPAGVTYVAGSLTSTKSKCLYASSFITCNVGELASDAKGVLEFKATVTGLKGSTIINIATTTYSEAAGNTFSNSTTNNIVGIQEFTCESGTVCDVTLGSGWNFFRMVVASKVSFLHNGASHAVELTSSTVAAKKGGLRITSDPVNVAINEGQIVGVDSNGNGLEDLDVMIQTVESDKISIVGIKEKTEGVLPSVCGDNKCNGTETCGSCAKDCGACVVPPVCGDNKCNGAETCSTCSKDCGACVVVPEVLPGTTIVPSEISVEVVETKCGDKLDNDGDDKIDLDDPGCFDLNDTDETDLAIIPVEEIPATTVSVDVDQPVDTFATIVSGLTGADSDTIQKIVTSALLYTIDNPVIEKVNFWVQEPIALTTTVASLAAVTTVGLTSAMGVGVLTYLQFLFTQPIMLLTRRRRQNWGIVYNSITKQPLELAVVRVFEVGTNRLITTRVTDRFGRYQFIVKSGKYYVEVHRNEHKFPSEVIPTLISLSVNGAILDTNAPISENIVDGVYQNLYNGGVIEVQAGASGIINKAIPVDPNKNIKTNQIIFRQIMWHRIKALVTLIGPIIAIISYIINPATWVAILVVLQIVIYFVFKRLSRIHKPLTWGRVKDILTGKELKKTVVRVFDTRFNKLLDTQVTDNNGRYSFLVSKGEYYLTGHRDGYETFKSDVYNLAKQESAYLAEEIKMKKTPDVDVLPLA